MSNCLAFLAALGLAWVGLAQETAVVPTTVVHPGNGAAQQTLADERGQKLDARIAKIRETCGVEVHWKLNENFLPAPWRSKSKGIQITLDEAERLLGQIERFLTVVPKDVSGKHLKNIYLLHTLVVEGHTVCMAHGQDLFMGGNMGAYLLWPRLFHEFSHVLHERVRLDGKLWRSQMPEGSRHVGEKAMGGNPFSTNEDYYRKGFLMQYSQVSLEEEFAVLSDYAFTKQKELKGLMEKYPAVKNRVKLLIAYYKALSKEYDFSFYDDVLQDAGAPASTNP